MKYIPIILLFMVSCRTVKYNDRVEYRTDSTAVHELKEQLRSVREDSAALQERVSQLSENTVIFQDTGSTRIEYYPDGQLKVVEGRLKSVNSKLASEVAKAVYWQTRYDSLASVQSRDSVTTKVEYVTVTKTVKRTVFPWYFWLIVVVALGVGYYVKRKL